LPTVHSTEGGRQFASLSLCGHERWLIELSAYVHEVALQT